MSRESTLIFEREFGWRALPIRALYRLYGFQDVVVCQTRRMMESLQRNTRGRFADKCRVLRNPVDLQQIAREMSSADAHFPAVPATAMKIVWCGRLIQAKAPIRAIETLQKFRQLGHMDAHLIIIGDGPLEGAVRQAVERLKVEGCVSLMGRVSHPASVMALCDYGLITSDIEGFPNVLLEMLAAGVKGVVTTDCAGDLESIPGVHVASNYNADALARKLDEALRVQAPVRLEAFLRRVGFRQYLEELLGQ